MFNHDIEVNINLNRMGVAWFQQHSPKVTTPHTQKTTINNIAEVDRYSSSNGGICYRCQPHHISMNPCTASYGSNARKQRNEHYTPTISHDARKTPITLRQSKRIRHINTSSKGEDPLELVDLIDIEDEEHCSSAFFVGMNNNGLGLLNSSQPTNNAKRCPIDISNNHHNVNNISQIPIEYSSTNKSSCNVNYSSTTQRRAVESEATPVICPVSSNINKVNSTITNAVNTISISNNQIKRNLVNEIIE